MKFEVESETTMNLKGSIKESKQWMNYPKCGRIYFWKHYICGFFRSMFGRKKICLDIEVTKPRPITNEFIPVMPKLDTSKARDIFGMEEKKVEPVLIHHDYSAAEARVMASLASGVPVQIVQPPEGKTVTGRHQPHQNDDLKELLQLAIKKTKAAPNLKQMEKRRRRTGRNR